MRTGKHTVADVIFKNTNLRHLGFCVVSLKVGRMHHHEWMIKNDS